MFKVLIKGELNTLTILLDCFVLQLCVNHLSHADFYDQNSLTNQLLMFIFGSCDARRTGKAKKIILNIKIISCLFDDIIFLQIKIFSKDKLMENP